MAFLEVEGLGRDFPGVRALDNVSLKLELGRVHVLAGENGAGKSTLVKLITGSDPSPTRGRIIIDGRDVVEDPEKFRFIAYVPQELSLFPHLSVAENLFIPYDRADFTGRLISQHALERVGDQLEPHRLRRGAHVVGRHAQIVLGLRNLLPIAFGVLLPRPFQLRQLSRLCMSGHRGTYFP